MEVEKSESTKQYEEQVKTGLLLNNLEIKSKAETFPDGVAIEPELLPMKPKLEAPSTLTFDYSGLVRAYRFGLSHVYRLQRSIDLKKAETQLKEGVHAISVQASLMKTSAHQWSIVMFEKLRAFLAAFIAWVSDARAKWYIESKHHSQRILASMNKVIPYDSFEVAFQEVRKALTSVSRSYDRLHGRCVQKSRALRREFCPVDTPICFREEQKVAQCFEKLMNDTENVIQCIGPLDLYKKCVETHAEKLKL